MTRATNQIVSTPREFIIAVENRFGSIGLDIAANETNCVSPCDYYGPGSETEDAFAASDWQARDGKLSFCNPPFNNIARFAERCASERTVGARIALLVPASICTGWWVKHVAPHAYVFALTPRVFKKEIRDCALALYEPAGYRGMEVWRWK